MAQTAHCEYQCIRDIIDQHMVVTTQALRPTTRPFPMCPVFVPVGCHRCCRSTEGEVGMRYEARGGIQGLGFRVLGFYARSGRSSMWRPLHQMWLGRHIIDAMLIQRMTHAMRFSFPPQAARSATTELGRPRAPKLIFFGPQFCYDFSKHFVLRNQFLEPSRGVPPL